MDGVETHAHHQHSSGHRAFDFVVSGSAVLISCVSLFVAVQHGRTMEKLVEANSLPNVELNGSVSYGDKPDQLALDLSLANSGVGPARIESIELWEDGKPVRSVNDIAAAIKSEAGGARGQADLGSSTVIESLIGAGKSRSFVHFTFQGVEHWFPALSKTIIKFEDRVCYCSVFDECFVSDSRRHKGRPDSVRQCPEPIIPYDDSINALAARQSLIAAHLPQPPKVDSPAP